MTQAPEGREAADVPGEGSAPGLRLGLTPGLPDDAYISDGLLTKFEARAVTLAALAPRAGELLWDVGGGTGSIGIEWMRAHPDCRAITVESRGERADRIEANAVALGAPGLLVVRGRAPAALEGLPTPDAVFVGGGLTSPGLLDACWKALRPGGRIVANTVTVESEVVLAGAYARFSGSLTRIGVERAQPIGGFLSWQPLRTVTQWAADKPA